MASSTITRDRLLSSTGLDRAMVDSLMRALRDEGVLPRAGQGGGKGAVHYNSRILALLMLSLAALRPVDAAAVAMRLRDFRFQSHSHEDRGSRPYEILGDELANWIEGAASAARLGKSFTDESLRMLRSWQLNICLESSVVFISVDYQEGEATDTIYAGDSPASPGLRRHTILNGEVLLAFGELWADTLISRELAALRKPSAATQELSARAEPENVNAGYLCQEAPASTNNQSHLASGTDGFSTSDTNGTGSGRQSSDRGGIGHDSFGDEPDLFSRSRSVPCLTMS